jgi:Leucine-rich repeat (LRR) protein
MEFTYTGIETIPEGTIKLCCSINNDLTSLPLLPVSLRELHCYNNQLTSLPPLPASLRYLNCSYNQLTSLPPLPEGLRGLNCGNNQLTSLPQLPESLRGLSCGNNQLTSLPPLVMLVNLRGLYCDNNQLTSLPPPPEGLQVLHCWNNPLPEENLRNNWLSEYKFMKYQQTIEEILQLKKLVQKQQIIIEEMKMVPGYGEYYQEAKKRYETRIQLLNEN